MSGLFGDIGNGLKDIFGKAVKFTQSPYGMAAAASLSSGKGLGEAAYAGGQYEQQMQQMQLMQQMRDGQLARQQQNDEYSNALKQAQTSYYGLGHKSGSTPSSVQEWNSYNALSPEDQQRYLLMKRSGMNKVTDVNSVPTLVNVAPGSTTPTTTPLTTFDKTSEAKANLKGAEVRGKLEAETIYNAQQELPKLIDSAAESVRLIDEMVGSEDGSIPEHPGFRDSVGPMDGRTPIVRGPALDFKSRFDQMKGKQFMEAYQGLKGGGQITEVEGTKAENAISRMKLAITEEAFVKAAREFQGIIKRGAERATNKANPPVQIKNANDYYGLPSGAIFIDPNGVRRQKP